MFYIFKPLLNLTIFSLTVLLMLIHLHFQPYPAPIPTVLLPFSSEPTGKCAKELDIGYR